jgi:hypothetical protein
MAIEEVHAAPLLSVDSPLDSWVLDSRASFHTTPICEVFKNYMVRDFRKVYFADKTALDVVGLGDVSIRVRSDLVWKLQKVKHILELKKNLILGIQFISTVESRRSVRELGFCLVVIRRVLFI